MSTVRPNLKAFAYFDHTDEDCIASTGFAILTAKEQVDPKFILYAILSDDIAAQIEAHVVGSNYPALNSRDVRRLLVLKPPYPEQRKIARILTTVDNLIEKTEALIAKYQAIKQGMMHDLFTRGVDENGHLRPTYEEAPDLYKPSELGWIPKEWEVERFRDRLREGVGRHCHFHDRTISENKALCCVRSQNSVCQTRSRQTTYSTSHRHSTTIQHNEVPVGRMTSSQ